MIGDLRDDRRDRDVAGDAGVIQRLDRGEALARLRRARLERPRHLWVERRHRQRDRREAQVRGLLEQVDVAQHPVRLGGDGEGMAGFDQQLDDRARDPPALLDRLIGIGVGAHRDRPAFVAGPRERRVEQLRRIGLDEQPRFEIHAGRKVVIGVGRPREAIDAAMLAAAKGVDRAIEADVGRAVAGQDRFGMLDRDRGPALRNAVERLDLIEPFAVVGPLLEVEARGGGIAGGSAAVARLDRHSRQFSR